MRDIFISHVEEDQDIALGIADGLEEAGYSTWYYERDSRMGQDFVDEVSRGIAESRAVVLVISQETLKSYHVDHEVRTAYNRSKPFLPVLRDLTHAEVLKHKEGWEIPLGTVVSVPLPPGGVADILSRLIEGLVGSGIVPATPTATEPESDPTASAVLPSTTDEQAVHEEASQKASAKQLTVTLANLFSHLSPKVRWLGLVVPVLVAACVLTVRHFQANGRTQVSSQQSEAPPSTSADESQPQGARPPRLSPEPPTGTKFSTRPPRGSGKTNTNRKDGAEMILIPAGEFTMGSNDSDDEKPPHKVTLDGYWIYRHEVTVAQYRKFCKATGRSIPEAPSWGWKDDHPIVNVSWNDATVYAKWAGVRLPTEAEWEKAARGTDGRKFPWGNDSDNSKCANSLGQRLSSTKPVGSYPAGASPYGVMDMAGNVWQWCADWYGADYYKSAPSRNPKGPSSGQARVLRGGSWGFNNESSFRAADRDDYLPDIRNYNFGFRCSQGL